MPQRLKTAAEIRASGNGGGFSRAELSEREEIEAAKRGVYGIPDPPGDLDGEERKAWDALVLKHRDRLYLSDAEELAEAARIQALLSAALRHAKKGATVKGKRNPAFAQANQLMKMRRELLAPIMARQPAPKAETTAMDQIDRIIASKKQEPEVN